VPEEPEGYINYVQRAYESQNNGELGFNYDALVDTYDRDTIYNWGRQYPDVGVAAFAKHIDVNARVLDAGVGTGIVGKLLVDKGYRHIVGIDFSDGMLEQARLKDVCDDLRQVVLGEHFDFPIGEFDAVISIGVFM